MRSKASDTLRLNIYKALNANTLSRLSPSFRDFYLFAFFALVSCKFRVGKNAHTGIRASTQPAKTHTEKKRELLKVDTNVL